MDRNNAGREFMNEKLSMIANDFKGYQQSMDINKRARQEKEEEDIHKLGVDIVRLNDILNQEVKRRTETNKAVVGMFEAHMSTVQDKLEAGVTHRLDTLTASVESLNKRIEIVEKDFASSQEGYRADMEDKGRLVAQDIVSLKESFDEEKRERRDRETLMIARLRDLEERSAEALVKESRRLEAEITQLQEELNTVGHEEDRRFHDFVFQEMAWLKTGLLHESQTRETSDDEIVAALNHYTQSVQEAMRVINQA